MGVVGGAAICVDGCAGTGVLSSVSGRFNMQTADHETYVVVAESSWAGAKAVAVETDCLFVLSLFNTELALLTNLENPPGLRPSPPAPPAAESLILQDGGS